MPAPAGGQDTDKTHFPGAPVLIERPRPPPCRPSADACAMPAGFSSTQLAAMFVAQLHEAVQVTLPYTIAGETRAQSSLDGLMSA